MQRVRLEGAAELEHKLKQLEAKVSKQIVRKALRAGSKVVLAKAKQLAPKRTGLLRRSLKVRAAKRRKGFVRFTVQTRDGDYKGETFYGAFVEFGHRRGKRSGALKRVIAATGDDPRGLVPPRPFLKPAFEASKEAALQTIIDVTRQGLL